MKSDKNFLPYVIRRRAFAGSLVVMLALQLLLFSSFAPVAADNQAGNVKPGWLTPSATAMERLATYQDGGDPNSDLHLGFRKQTKVKCVKKLNTSVSQSGRGTEPSDHSRHFSAGFDTVKRPAYYVFLFRYTLF